MAETPLRPSTISVLFATLIIFHKKDLLLDHALEAANIRIIRAPISEIPTSTTGKNAENKKP